MKLTLDAAAKQADVSKSTLLRAIKRGDLSAEKHGDRAFVVDRSEVARWAAARAAAAPASPDDEPRHVLPQSEAAPDVTRDDAAWRVRAEMLERMLDAERATVADLRARLDKSEDARAGEQAATREAIAAIPKQIAPPDTPAPVTERPRRRWPWQR